MQNTIRYIDKPIYLLPEDKIDNLITEIQQHKPDMLIFLGRTGYVRELHYALVNKNESDLIIYDFIVEPQAHYYYKDFKLKLDKFMQRLKKISEEENVQVLPIINTHNKEFIQTIYKSNYSYILVRIKNKEDSNELLLSTPLLSGTEEMNLIIDEGLDLRP